ncbi:hypothetical protein EW15_0093 [Prochlorococcus sp. MIT 0801]|nr:hypothetical protein EW15_0093 [Prochlorococcus sp. MIT 0801]
MLIYYANNSSRGGEKKEPLNLKKRFHNKRLLIKRCLISEESFQKWL